MGQSPADVTSHIESKHVEKRTDTNLELLSKFLFKPIADRATNHWEDGLSFLTTLSLSEPTFRQSLITKIYGDTEHIFLEAALDTIECIVEARKKPKGAERNSLDSTRDFASTPVELLIFLIEQLVLFPSSADEIEQSSASFHQVIQQRLILFRSGQLRELYAASRKVISKTPTEFDADAEVIQKSAQSAANLDNFKSAVARLVKNCPVAKITKGITGNLQALEKLFPPPLRLSDSFTPTGYSLRSSLANRKRVVISKSLIIKALRGLNKGKAAGLQVDSLDLFIKLSKLQRKSKKNKLRTTRNEILAAYFTGVANGDVPAKIGKLLRTTYLVALEKDPNDKSKLRPLGVPAAVRRITGVLILMQYRTDFATYLLPFNYAVGVNGGVDLITNTVRLAVDKYIVQKEARGELPTRSLVSLDIVNMFNAVSRRRLRTIIAREFPELANFADLLYEQEGSTAVKLADGTWHYIPVREGFSQGCPMSPVFAALVLDEILKKIDGELRERARVRKYVDRKPGDDHEGGIPLLLAYVDDCNCVLPHIDVEFFLQQFKRYGEPLGAVMNTTKTRIMTATNGKKTSDALKRGPPGFGWRTIGFSLAAAVAAFSTTPVLGVPVGVEVTDGLRVLGAPIGSQSFCHDFINEAMSKASSDSKKILAGLDDQQTKLQLFKTCTIHKMTHLFASDVLNSDLSDLPNNWHLWRSDMATSFGQMTNEFLAELTDCTAADIPQHSQLIASMSTNRGGLGLQHPRCTALPMTMLTTKRCIEYATQGVWVGPTADPVPLPKSITQFYESWQSSPAPLFRVFNKYLPHVVKVCVKDPDSACPTTHFIYRSSPKTCKERLKDEAASRVRSWLQRNLKCKITKAKLDDLLQPSTAKSLTEMPRSEPSNRQKNKNFTINLKRKLRLYLWDRRISVRCKCGEVMDHYGDHAFACTASKTTMHNQIRDGLVELLQRLLITVRLIHTPTAVTDETPRILPSLPRLRPFDLSVKLDQLLMDKSWRCPLNYIGFDVYCISSMISSSHRSQQNQNKASFIRLQDGEKEKFCRRGASDKKKKTTLSGDDIMREILQVDSALIPIAVTEFGSFGPLFNRFMFGKAAPLAPDYGEDWQNATAAARRARSNKVPKGIIPRANKIWRSEHIDEFYGYSYKAMDPGTYTTQRLGLITSTATSNHLLRAYQSATTTPSAPAPCNDASMMDSVACFVDTDDALITEVMDAPALQVGDTDDGSSDVCENNDGVVRTM